MRVFNRQPNSWGELQDFVGKMFSECNFDTQISKKIELVRGFKEIDVYAQDLSSEYKPIILVECKYWDSLVKQETVHSFRTVVSDFGANIGFIVSKSGFQSGCYEAAKNTNIKLVSLDELQDVYHQRWRKEMIKNHVTYAVPLRPYWHCSSPLPPNKNVESVDFNTQVLIGKAYEPICDLLLRDFFENGFVKYPFHIPVINDEFEVIGSKEIKNDREYFDFCEENHKNALRHFKILFKE